MAQAMNKAVVAAELENYLNGVAKHFNERVYGAEGMPWGTKFADLEEIAVHLGQTVSRNMIEQAVARQAATVPEEVKRCSGCDQPVAKVGDAPQPRAVATQVGTAQWNEPKRYCPRCRAAFFTSVAEFGDRSGES